MTYIYVVRRQRVKLYVKTIYDVNHSLQLCDSTLLVHYNNRSVDITQAQICYTVFRELVLLPSAGE